MKNQTTEYVRKTKEALKNRKKILIVSHVHPDPDAIGSVLALREILMQKHKKVDVNVEGSLPQNLDFLSGFDAISTDGLLERLQKGEYDLLICLDGNEYHRFTQEPVEDLKDYLEQSQLDVLSIDHHISKEESFTFYFHPVVSSTAEILYQIFIRELGFKLTTTIAENLLTGILGDTGRFLYKNDGHRETFAVVSDLIDSGVTINDLEYKMLQYTEGQLPIITELITNTVVDDEFIYSSLSDEFFRTQVRKKISSAEYSFAYHSYMAMFLRSVEYKKWGFVILPTYEKPGIYKCSFRALADTVDTTLFSGAFGGGGHKPASGCSIEAGSTEEALSKILKVIYEQK